MKHSIEQYKQLLDVAQVGWWEADIDRQMFYFSDFPARLMGLEGNSLAFKEFTQRIRADHRERIIAEFYKVLSIETYEQVFPVSTCYGYKWVRSKFCSTMKEEGGGLHVLGVTQLLVDQHADATAEEVRMRVNEVLNHIGNLSNITQSFTRDRNLDESVNQLLHYLLASLAGVVGHVFLMNFDYRNQLFSCNYEVCSEGRTPNLGMWQQIPMEAFPWFMEKLRAGIPVTLNTVDDLPPSAVAERALLTSKEIYSMMLIPLKDKEVVTGCLGLNTYQSSRLWNTDDFVWLTSAAQLISSLMGMMKMLHALEKNEELFRLISQFAGVGYARYNLNSMEGNALDQWFYNLGEKPGTPLSEVIGAYKAIHPDDKKLFVDFLEKARRNEVDHFHSEVRVYTPDGWKWVRTSIMKNPHCPNPDDADMISLNFDISELKLSREMQNKAEELERVKTAFFANITHDIKTPLNAIVGFSTLLGEENDPEERQNYVEIIRVNNELLLQLIANVLDLAKIESGMIRLNYTEVNLQDVFYDVAASMRFRLSPAVKLVVAADLPACTILSDRLRLIQVLSNLVNNAVKYTEKGSVTIAYERLPGEVLFSVTDTGEGISAEKQTHIFDRFYKGHKPGTGLGLPICQGIVEQFGGRMGVTSELGKGTRFWFTLPC